MGMPVQHCMEHLFWEYYGIGLYQKVNEGNPGTEPQQILAIWHINIILGGENAAGQIRLPS
jgi:hypothetical protein